MSNIRKKKAQLLGSVATSAALVFGVPAFAATGDINISTLSAISNASLAITSPQDNTATVTATTSTGGTPVVIELAAYATAGDVATGSFGVSGNIASATATGNTTATPNGNLLQITVLPTFADSAAVSGLQTNTGAISSISTGVDISAAILDVGPTVHELQGALTVDGNTVSTSSTANNAVNTLSIADNVSVATTGMPAGVSTGVTAGVSNAQAELLVNSVQSSVTGDTVATTTGTTIDITAESVDLSTVLLDSNRIAATARGNVSANTVDSGTNSANLDGSVAVANYQRLNGSDAIATVSGSTLAITAGTTTAGFGVDNSTVGINSNTTSAAATANGTTQTLNLSANDVLGNSVPVILTSDYLNGPLQAQVQVAGASISNVQDRTGSIATATNTGGTVALTATSGIAGDVILDSTLSVITNKAEAVAVGNNAAGSMLLEGNTVGGAAGIVSAQSGDSASTTTASVLANAVTLNALDNLSTSTAELTGNTQRAIAAGNIAASSLNVGTNEANLYVTGGTAAASTNFSGANVVSNYAVETLQAQLGNVTAEALNGGFTVDADANVAAASTVTNDANTRVAAAYGNDASSRIAIDATVIDPNAFTEVAASVSQQELNASVLARANGDSVVTTNVDGSVLNSSVSTSSNTVEAMAMGNRTTTTSVMVGATTIDTQSPAAAAATVVDATSARGGASFDAVSSQIAQGAVTASLRDSLNLDSSWIETAVAGDVISSSVTSELNTLRASAAANTGLTAVALDATNINTTTSVANAQIAQANVSALIGVAGTGATPADPFSYTEVLADGYVWNSGTKSIVSGNFTVDGAGLTAAQRSYLTSVLGYTLSTGTTYTKDAAGTSATLIQLGTLTTGVAQSATIPATNGSLNEGGITLTALGDVTDSTLSVLSNLTSGSVTGNAATNSVSVTGTNVGAGSTSTESQTYLVGANNLGAIADQALVNAQIVTAPSLNSEVYGSFAVATDAAVADITLRSTVEVAGNTQSAAATGNTGTNSTLLDASNLSSTSALASSQEVGAANIDALSDVQMVVEAGANSSSISISTNRNQSVALANTVNNTMTATGANVSGLVVNTAVIDDAAVTSKATHALASYQSAGGTIDSTAITDIFNSDLVAATTIDVINSSLAFDKNVTISEASGNNATNRGILGGDGASLTASGVVSNVQTSTADITSTVDTNVNVSLLASALSDVAAQRSTLTVDGNQSTATARANAATNSLTANATLVDDPRVVEWLADTNIFGTEQALFVLGSDQNVSTNDSIDAVAAGTFGISLNNDAASSYASTNSSVSVSSNILTSQGVGNVVSNSATVSGTTVDASTLVASEQRSEADITANTGMDLVVATASSGSTVEMSGNMARAFAVQNDASNSLSLTGTNVALTGTDTANINNFGAFNASSGLSNYQETAAVASTVSNVTLTAHNQEAGYASTTGVLNGTVAFDKNVAVADATSNRATNIVTVGGGATIGASAALLNSQSNLASASANATTDLQLQLDTGAAGLGPVINGSTASVDGNSTTATARGNMANNVLNASAANMSGSGTSLTTLVSGSTAVPLVSATYGVLNAQTNGAIITAAVDNTTYGMALNTSLSGDTDATTNGTLSVAGNIATAQASGNTAATSLTLTGLNSSSATAAIGSAQTNSGNVIASIASTTIGSSSYAGISSGAITVAGNMLTASATGNSVTNLIRRD